MAHYQKQGTIPHKRHTQFRKENGELYSEQLFSTEGFSNDYSLLYHIHPPTAIIKTGRVKDLRPLAMQEEPLSHRSFEGFDIKSKEDYLDSRKTILFNKDLHIALAAPQKKFDALFL